MARIPEKVLEEIQDRLDIVEIISSYIPLKRAGRNFKALCPFHHEKTSSFMVNPQKRIFHCFGCGVGGDVFGFVMKYERIDFPEAVRLLAEKAGVDLPAGIDEPDADRSLLASIQKANEVACAYYHRLLFEEKVVAPRDYLTQRRIREQTVREFRLGFAPDSHNGLVSFCRSQGVSADVLEKAGLLVRRLEGGMSERFRRKIVFPIFDVKSRVVGFGARVLDDSQPKYVNSPETPLFSKSKCLYGIHFAGKHIRTSDKALIVEGYVDFLTPYQNEIRNVVASLGTALTIEQVRLLARFTKNVVMVYDGDQAGEAATLRGMDVLVGEGFSVRVAALDIGHDPDTFVLKRGIDSFAKKTEQAQDLFDYKLNLLSRRHDRKSVEGKARIISEMLTTLARIENAVLKSLYVKRLSEELLCDERAIWTELGKEKVQDYDYRNESPAAQTKRQLRPAEKICAALILDDHELAKDALKDISPSEFKDGNIRAIVEHICEYVRQGKAYDAAKVITHLGDEGKSQVAAELALSGDGVLDKRKALRDCIKRIKQDNLKERLNELQAEIRIAQGLKEDDKVNNLLLECRELTRKYVQWGK